MEKNVNNVFIETLYEMFPDVKNLGKVSRKQLVQVSEACGVPIPQKLTKTKLDRGVYDLESKTSTEVKFVPEIDKSYVPFGNYKDVETVITSGLFYPIFISGPTGNGKTTMVEQICAKNKREYIRVNMNLMSDEDQLICTKTLTDGNIEVVEGPVLIAMRRGAILLIDEISAASSNLILSIQSIMEGKPYYIKAKNEIITPAPGFNIVACDNTKGKGDDTGRYAGLQVLNEAFLERFALTFEQDYPDAKTETRIVNNYMKLLGIQNDDFVSNLIKWADAIRKTFKDGGVDETMTTRRIVQIVKAYSIFKDEKKSVQLCCNRFDDSTKDAFLTLFEKIITPTPEDAKNIIIDDVVNKSIKDEEF